MTFFPIIPPGLSPAIPTYVDNDTASSLATRTHTFSSVSFGTAQSDRVIIVGFVCPSGGEGVSSATIGGITASNRLELITGNDSLTFLSATVPTGTSGNVVVTTNSTPSANNAGIIVWSVNGLVSAVPSSTATDDTSTGNAYSNSLTIPEDGFGLGLALQGDNTFRTWSWTNLTEDIDTATGNGSFSGASSTTQSSSTRTATASGTVDGGLILAAWR